MKVPTGAGRFLVFFLFLFLSPPYLFAIEGEEKTFVAMEYEKARLERIKQQIGWTEDDDIEATGGKVAPLSREEGRALEGRFLQVHVPVDHDGGGADEW